MTDHLDDAEHALNVACNLHMDPKPSPFVMQLYHSLRYVLAAMPRSSAPPVERKGPEPDSSPKCTCVPDGTGGSDFKDRCPIHGTELAYVQVVAASYHEGFVRFQANIGSTYELVTRATERFPVGRRMALPEHTQLIPAVPARRKEQNETEATKDVGLRMGRATPTTRNRETQGGVREGAAPGQAAEIPEPVVTHGTAGAMPWESDQFDRLCATERKGYIAGLYAAGRFVGYAVNGVEHLADIIFARAEECEKASPSPVVPDGGAGRPSDPLLCEAYFDAVNRGQDDIDTFGLRAVADYCIAWARAHGLTGQACGSCGGTVGLFVVCRDCHGTGRTHEQSRPEPEGGEATDEELDALRQAVAHEWRTRPRHGEVFRPTDLVHAENRAIYESGRAFERGKTGGANVNKWRNRLRDYCDAAGVTELGVFPGERFDDGHKPTEEEHELVAEQVYKTLTGITPSTEIDPTTLDVADAAPPGAGGKGALDLTEEEWGALEWCVNEAEACKQSAPALAAIRKLNARFGIEAAKAPAPPAASETAKCPDCDGVGEVPHVQAMCRGETMACPRCKGTGTRTSPATFGTEDHVWFAYVRACELDEAAGRARPAFPLLSDDQKAFFERFYQIARETAGRSKKMTPSAYEKLIAEDREWLATHAQDCLERQHIDLVLEHSFEQEYPSAAEDIRARLAAWEPIVRACEQQMPLGRVGLSVVRLFDALPVALRPRREE